MADTASHLFWDSCVFYAFLRDERGSYDIDSIAQYLQEAKVGKHRIYASSLVLAEVVPSAITRPDIGTFEDFLNDLQGAVTVIGPSPNVMLAAAKLKDLPYKKGISPGRRLSTPDAIMLAGCLDLIQVHGIRIDAFHTFDDGRKRDPVHGRMVPLISYQDWCEGFAPNEMAVAQPVINLNRKPPIHPSPELLPAT